MLCNSPALIWILFSYILLSLIFVNCDVTLNCGSDDLTLTALDGREWVGESASGYFPGKSRSSTAKLTSFSGVDPVPYRTSRISAAEFYYQFHLNPGQKFIRLHFYPATYRGLERSVDYFNVKAGPFTLLRDYSASFDADTLGAKKIVKEFCLNVEENAQLKITFTPSRNSSSKYSVYAFVNGIEIISMPTGLYYTPEGEIGARVVGLRNQFYIIDNSTALEAVHRFNVGGSSITPVEDYGLFRQWNADANYFLESTAHQANSMPLHIRYISIPAFVAPPKIFHTSWKSRSIGANEVSNLRWKVPVDPGFGYLVRLHFCDFDPVVSDREERDFNVVINNQIAETKANVVRWSGGAGIPVYRNYVVILKGDVGCGRYDLLIGLEAVDGLVLKLFNGLEIFKLSDMRNNLAAPNLVVPERILTSKNASVHFSKINVFGTGMTVLIVILSLITHKVRFLLEANFPDGKHEKSASTERHSYCFSFADIKRATQNFREELVIGRGGFGKVYKGFIPGVAKTVAIKRLNPSSKQGALEFWTEIETFSKLRHFHIVSLIGYCNDAQEMILVYEYMPCGTLADNLYKFTRNEMEFTPLTWEQRLRICFGAASGLEYLHTGSQYGVIHRDVKDTNILLDENFVAKISDFGLSKLERISHSKNYVSTNVKGTVGYLDPDYYMTHRLTRKSDVYSFGMVMLVILSGKPAVDFRREPQSLLTCFRECMADGDFSKIVDLSLQGKISSNSLGEFVKIAGNCLQELPKRRPTMTQVVADLEQVLKKHGENVFASADMLDLSFEQGNIQSFQLQLEAESVIPTPSEVITGITPSGSKSLYPQLQSQNSLNKGEHLQPRGQDSVPSRKPLWVWPWRAVRNRGNKQEAEESFPADVLLYDYQTLADATQNFHAKNLITSGFSDVVYKGMLMNGQDVVVRNSSSQGDMEFKGEIVLMQKLEHHNIVRLLGCCTERSRRLIVHEYMPSLDAYLFDSEKADLLDWNRRKVIIEGIASGLLYLHRGHPNVKLVHGDLNRVNILLDKDLKPKIFCSDLGRILGRVRHLTTAISRACNHLAPEYFLQGVLTEKSDVYSYGMLLLQIITGKKLYLDYKGCLQPLGEQDWRHWNENEMIKLVDSAIICPDNKMEILRFVHVSLLCVQYSESDRPDIPTLLAMLKNEIAELPQPKRLQADSTGSSLEESESCRLQDSVCDIGSTSFEAR